MSLSRKAQDVPVSQSTQADQSTAVCWALGFTKVAIVEDHKGDLEPE